MTKLLISIFIKDAHNITDNIIRKKYNTLCSITGLLCNILLFIVKFIMGMISGSIAVTADAFNNLSDAGSSLVTLAGFHISSKPADREHPFGHGRMEYLTGLIISFFILLVGIEFVKTSINKIIHPEPIIFSWIVVIALVLSILVKLWMSKFYYYVGKKIDASPLRASAVDSLSDVFATAVTLVSVVFCKFTDLPIDGYMGIIVAGFILYAGYSTAKDTIDPLLGRPPEPELVHRIQEIMMSYNQILGVHDLIVHDYGPGRIMATAHAEVSVDADIMEAHDEIDQAEMQISKELNIHMVIHLDPINTDCEITAAAKEVVLETLNEISSELSIHDFRIVEGPSHTNLIFDILVPPEFSLSESELIEKLEKSVKEKNPKYNLAINIDRSYI